MIERGIMAVTAPLQSLLTGTYDFFSNTYQEYVALVGLSKENKRLKLQIAELRSQNTKLEEAYIQNKRLKRIVNLEESRKYELLVCSVIGVDPSKFYRSVFIDRGATDGVSSNMPVIAYDGAVGKVVKVSPHSARVQLLTDQQSSVAVLAQRSRAPGILQGTGAGSCELVYVDAKADLEKGDLLLTSGLGGIFPRGLRTGEVTSIVHKVGEVTKKAEVSTFVNVYQLEEVFVLLTERKGELDMLKTQGW